jgi:hypothetical protein
MRGEGGVAGSRPMGTVVHSNPNYFEDLTPYLTYGRETPLLKVPNLCTALYIYTHACHFNFRDGYFVLNT